MISDPADPVVLATRALDAAQRDYDAALVSGRGLPANRRLGLSVRLAAARRDLRTAIYGVSDRIDEAPILARLLPALVPFADEE